MKWSNDTINKVAEHMVKPIDDEREAIRKEVVSILSNVCGKYIPKEVGELANKYPSIMLWNVHIYFKSDKDADTEGVPVLLPLGDKFITAITKSSYVDVCKMAGISQQAEKLNSLRLVKNQTKNRIKCTLSGLRTEAKIRIALL